MKVPYALRPLPIAEPAAAVLLPGHDVGELLALLAGLGLDPLPPVYAVADGYLIRLPGNGERVPVGVVRLRALAPNLLLPAAAELIPPLLPDEAAALVRQRGLVFLPGRRVLAYAPDRPLDLAALWHVGAVRRRGWQSVPRVTAPAPEVTEIALEVPSTSPEELLAPGGADIGTESAQPPDANILSKLFGQALFGLGKSLAWLGKTARVPGLAQVGASLLDTALRWMPRLSERLMGAQAAALRELLRCFRAGDIEEALRRALPLGGDPARGAVPAPDARLPVHGLYYSLLDLLGGTPRGPASVWFAPTDTYQELLNEYRKQAELAVRRGDFRRAAFIYGRLLGDFRAAALILGRGGLHRDAALLYERKLNDLLAAARAWEAAGEIDRAVALYRTLSEHALAGDLLRRAGEEERALAEYQLAASKLAEEETRFYEAGELLRSRAQRPDLARDYFAKGWAARPVGSAVPCAVRLAQHHARAAQVAPLLELLDEADLFLETADAEPAGLFYNEVAELAAAPGLEPAADELRDRALCGIARKLRQSGAGAAGQRTWGALFRGGAAWSAPMLRDAQYAQKRHTPAPARSAKPLHRTIHTRAAAVTAACQLATTGDIFLGFETGEVVCYRPATDDVIAVTRQGGSIVSMLTYGPTGKLVVLSRTGHARSELAHYSRSVGFRMSASTEIATPEPAWLCTPDVLSAPSLVVVAVGKAFSSYHLADLTPHSTHLAHRTEEAPTAAVLLGQERGLRLLVFDALGMQIVREPFESGATTSSHDLSWQPAAHAASTLAPAVHVLRRPDDTIQLTGLDAKGSLHQTQLRPPATRMHMTMIHHPVDGEPYRAFAVLGGELLAGVSVHGIDWCKPARVRPEQTRLPLHNPVAAFPLAGGASLVVVSANGTLTIVHGQQISPALAGGRDAKNFGQGQG